MEKNKYNIPLPEFIAANTTDCNKLICDESR